MKHANIAIFVPHNGCPHTCAFCNQRVISGEQAQPTPQDVAVAAECAIASLGEDSRSSEIAFFGGSFTAIEREYMISLLEAAAPYVHSGKIGGIRCSTRPDCIDDEVLDILLKYGVSAIELGAQSMDNRVLAMNKRGHTSQQVKDAARLIKRRGIELGLQMMTGLYGDTDEGAMNTARELAALEPSTVRIYPTVVLRGTELARLYESGDYAPQSLEEAVPLCARLLKFFEAEAIKVIRLGLHAGRDIEREYVAGAYHPALRELCESRIMLEAAVEMLKNADSGAEYMLAVNPADISKMTGQHRCNLEELSRMGFRISKIISDADINKGQIRLLV